MKKLVLIFTLSLAMPIVAIGQDNLDDSSKEALQKTTDMLKDKKGRDSAISKDPKAIQADEFVKDFTGSGEVSEEVYSLAADVFPLLVAETNGDVAKMTELLKSFSKNPASFASKWTPEQRSKLEKLSKKLTPTQVQH